MSYSNKVYRAFAPPPPLAEPLATALYDFSIAVHAMNFSPEVRNKIMDLMCEVRAVASEGAGK
jgi:hypothetical protein